MNVLTSSQQIDKYRTLHQVTVKVSPKYSRDGADINRCFTKNGRLCELFPQKIRGLDETQAPLEGRRDTHGDKAAAYQTCKLLQPPDRCVPTIHQLSAVPPVPLGSARSRSWHCADRVTAGVTCVAGSVT